MNDAAEELEMLAGRLYGGIRELLAQEAPEVGVVQESYPFGRLQVYIGCEVRFAHSPQGHCAGGNVFPVPSSSPARTASATLDGCVAGEAAGPRLQHNAEEREDCKERFLSERGR